jgi:hypothetical protein
VIGNGFSAFIGMFVMLWLTQIFYGWSSLNSRAARVFPTEPGEQSCYQGEREQDDPSTDAAC